MKKISLVVSLLGSLFMTTLAHADVARAIVTTGIAEREPINELTTVPAGNKKVLFFTEIRDMEGQQVKHRWVHGDEVMAEVDFNIGGPRWRVWSSKNLIPEWSGEWRVEVVDAEGNVVSEKSFSVEQDGMAATEESMGDVPPAQ